ncbi:MAG: hypothetical protein CMF17_11795 [Idiomarinaceae bacterium]|nr:hypothetical protein [Idiomarinaceae bacterium]
MPWIALTIRKVRWYEPDCPDICKPGKTLVVTRALKLGHGSVWEEWHIPYHLRADAIERLDKTVWCDVAQHHILKFQ